MVKKIKLALGSGWRNYGKDWIHIDGGDYKEVDENFCLWDLPYEDNSVDVIYASHVLEYFDRENAIEVLLEWKRVLGKGGKLYISVPDFERMSYLYQDHKIPLHKFLGPLYGKMKLNESTIYHKTVYDYSSLGELLRFLGFGKIDLYEPYGLIINIDDHSKAEIDGQRISLNLVCEKL